MIKDEEWTKSKEKRMIEILVENMWVPAAAVDLRIMNNERELIKVEALRVRKLTKERKPKKSAVIEVYCDGACEPINPGGTASYGVVIIRSGKRIYEASKLFHPVKGKENETSNNVAEYSGFIDAVEWLIENKLEKEPIVFHGDSRLVICQMFGDIKLGGKKWNMNGGFYVPLAKHAEFLLTQFTQATGKWIPREENTIADELSKAELIKAGIQFRIQPRK